MIGETAERYGRLDVVVNNIARFDEMTVAASTRRCGWR